MKPAAQRLSARLISTLGHPALITPGAGLAALAGSGADPAALGLSAAVAAAVALFVLGFGWRQVRRGAWNHIDATAPTERRTHNGVALLLLAAGAGGAAAAGLRPLAAGLGAGALIIAMAIVFSRRLKLSQHAAFAALSAVLAWSIAPWAGALGLAFTALVGWSRLALVRHTRAEVLAGAISGLLAGLVLLLLASPA